jgi:hypothetical protein
MAEQNANTVAITGGSIDGTTVGATTASTGAFTTLSASSTVSGTGFSTYLASPPAIGGTAAAAGTFTTLTATGQTSLGGVAGSEGFRTYVPTTTGTWLSTRTTSASTFVGTEGTSLPLVVNTNSGIFSVRTSALGGVSLEQFRVSNTASAVNYVQVTGAATGAAPVMSAQGSDAAVGLTFNTKSTGVHTFQTNGTTRLLINSGGTVQLGYANAVPCFTAAGAASQVNGLQVAGSVAGSSPVLSTTGTDTDIDLTLTPKGAGRVNITTSIKPKVNSVASVTSPLAWNSTSYDEYALTALANALTISADANTAPADGQRMMFRFKDNGTAQALTWTTGSARAFRVVGVTLPTTTVASKLLYVGCIYNAADSRWDAIAVGQEA